MKGPLFGEAGASHADRCREEHKRRLDRSNPSLDLKGSPFLMNSACWGDLFSGWAIALAAGFVAVAALILWQLFFSRTVSNRWLMVFAGFTVAVAGLFAAQQAHRGAVHAQNLAALKAFDNEANQLLEDGLALDNAADKAAYRARADGFSAKVQRWIADNMSPQASEIVRRQDPKDVNVGSDSAMDKQHASTTAEIIQTRKNIAALRNAGASDKCVKPTEPEHPIPVTPD